MTAADAPQSDHTGAWGVAGFAVGVALVAIGRGAPGQDALGLDALRQGTLGPAVLDQEGAIATVIAATAAPMLVYRLASSARRGGDDRGLRFERWRPSLDRVVSKCLAIYALTALMAFGYWLFPEYADGFYAPFRALFRIAAAAIVVLAPVYVVVVDGFMAEPEDGYHRLGEALRNGDIGDLGRHREVALASAVKFFFLPLMVSFAAEDIRVLFADPTATVSDWPDRFQYALRFLYFADVVFASVGYVFTLRLVDAHIRSTEPTAGGWVVALACYPPFWGLVGARYLAFGPLPERAVAALPDFGQYLVGGAVLALVAIYVWATVSFGLNFSNLTHRGIVTSGPYRLCRHPAYLCKNLSWWLLLLLQIDAFDAASGKRCLMLAMLSGLYYLRAATEEAHLARDPRYRAYLAASPTVVARLTAFAARLRHRPAGP